MLDVIIALMPALLAAVFFFGYHVLINAVVCAGAAVGTELLFGCAQKKDFSRAALKKSSVKDLSAVVTGLILALNLPSRLIVGGWDFNFYAAGAARTVENIIFSFDTVLICIIGGVFAIALVKMLFGGIGKNFANPAAAARIFIMLSFGLKAVGTVGFLADAATGATWLSSAAKSTSNQSMFLNMFLGNRGAAAAGETSMIAVLIGYVYLSVKKIIDFRLPLAVVASAAAFAFLFDALGRGSGPRILNNVFANVMAGGLVFGAVFMATDYSTSPNTFWGKMIFGAGIGFFTVVIRVFTAMPEGMSFAILLMNIAAPLIDKYVVPKPFGYARPQKPPPVTVTPPPATDAGAKREGKK
jgi:electron transport complex protein RnfD